EILHLSTPSSNEQEPQLYSSPSTKMIQTNLPKTDTTTTQIACGLSDITFKSFTCAGGEVEILGSLLHAEESIILSTDQGTSNTESEDGIISDTLPCETDNLTWKSFLCDGGEVEVSDATRLHNETIPLPKEELGAPLEYDSINLTNCFGDFDQQCQEEHADHPYCSHDGGVDPVIKALSETTRGSEKRANGLSFKSLDCTGGEIEIPREESVVLPADHSVSSSETHGYAIDSTEIAGDCDLQNDNTVGQFDHPYCNVQTHSSAPCDSLLTTQEALADGTEDVMVRHYSGSPVVSDSQAGSQGGVTADCCIPAEDEKLDEAQFPKKKTSLLHEDQIVICPLSENYLFTSITHDYCQDAFEDANSQQNNGEAVVATDPSAVSRSLVANGSLKALDTETVKCKGQEMLNCTVNPADSALPLVVQNTQISDCSQLAGSAESPSGVEVQQQDQEEHVSEVNSTRGPAESSGEKDSAIGSSGNAPALCNSAEKSHAENLTDVLKALSECPSVASALELGMFSPVRRASLSFLKTFGDPAQGKFAADDSAIEGEKTLFAPLNADRARLWAEQLESPMPHPLLNSTALGQNPGLSPLWEPVKDLGQKVSAEPQTEAEKPLLNFPLISDGPFQQQLRQMAEFLMMASGKMGPAAVSAPAPPPAPPAKAAPVKSHSVCVGSSPVKLVDHSLNTSGLFERKREFSVADSCTMTDPLLWNLPPGSLESLPRQELEQRLMSSMTMVEALVQQLTAARAQGRPLAGPAPSDLREKLVQTDHTELSQVSVDIYILFKGDLLCSFSTLYLDFWTLLEYRMMQKVKEALHQRNDMRTQMEEAFTAKEAAFSAMEQLRTHCATEISLLEKSVGSQQELLAALNQSYPELVRITSQKINSSIIVFKVICDLEASLGQSEQRVCELSRALAQSEEQLSQLQSLSQSQSLQIQQLQDVCTQLSGVREMNEFLQMENELAREQMAESERMLRENLQSLRERNIQCEDLKKEVCQLKLENGNLQEELKATRSRARTANLELEEKMAQAVTEITLLHHTLRGLTNKLHEELDEKESFSGGNISAQPPGTVIKNGTDNKSLKCNYNNKKQLSFTFSSVPSDTLEPQREALFSEMSAFTRIAAITPKKNMSTVEIEPEEEEQSHLAELLTGLGSTVTELVSTLKLVQQQKNAEVSFVFFQDEKMLAKLIVEVQDTQEILNKQKTDNNELRREITELRRALQQSKVESEFLRDELRKAGGQSTKQEHFMEENIKSLKEVERLKASLQEAEQVKVKILERAKRHVSPDRTRHQSLFIDLEEH
uniref:Sperm associated antigen 5 n=1 Tax=Pundamilia nyererei TaxID=303518 RepID=A0A3B4FVT3_9CICH